MLSVSPLMAGPPTAEEMQRFERHVSQGAEAMESEDYKQAVDELTMAAEIIDHPRLQLQLVEAYIALGRCDSAEQTTVELEERDDVDQAMRERIASRRAALEDCKGTGELFLRCDPEDLVVTIEDESFPCSEWMDLQAGVYRGTARHEGYASEPVRVEVLPDEPVEESVVLSKRSDAVDQEGRSKLTYSGLGSLGLGGLLMGFGVFQEMRTSGRAEKMIEARNAGDDEQIANLRSDASRSRALTIASFSLGLTAIASGTVLWWYSLARSDEEDSIADRRLDVGVQRRGIRLIFYWH